MVEIILIYAFLRLLDDVINLKLILHLLEEISISLLCHVLFIYDFEDFVGLIYRSEEFTVLIMLTLKRFYKLVGGTLFIIFEEGASVFHALLYAFFVTSFPQVIVVLQGSRVLSKIIIIHRLGVC